MNYLFAVSLIRTPNTIILSTSLLVTSKGPFLNAISGLDFTICLLERYKRSDSNRRIYKEQGDSHLLGAERAHLLTPWSVAREGKPRPLHSRTTNRSRNSFGSSHLWNGLGFNRRSGHMELSVAWALPMQREQLGCVGVGGEENGCASVINLLIVNYPPRHHIMCYLGKNKIAWTFPPSSSFKQITRVKTIYQSE